MKSLFNKIIFVALFIILFFNSNSWSANKRTGNVWDKERAAIWYANQPWISGCNFQPSTAINQIEMWMGSTFDAETIDRELGWAEELGFNTMRVFLSSVVWKNDAAGFKKRINQYLSISNKHHIKTMFVFFDDCWKEESTYGQQPEPRPGIHNSGWIQDPSCSLRTDTATLFPFLEKYVKDIVGTFKNDDRILMWDLYNEPGNKKHGVSSLPLLKNVFKWAREAQPTQPLTAGIWYFGTNDLNVFQLANSDIITYHNYSPANNHQTEINYLKMFGRPLICTEYMARRNNSLFKNIMPLLKQNNVGAINWGFVSGKTNTIFAWDEPMPNAAEPPLWFHDILRKDKTPFDPAEVELIKNMTGVNKQLNLLKQEDFNTTIQGKKVTLYTLRNKQGLAAQITNYGGRLVSLWTPDRDQHFADIIAGFNNINDYIKNDVYFGATIGRYANRIANAKFTINGHEYALEANDGKNHLHGGFNGFHKVVWNAKPFKTKYNEDALELSYISKDGAGGYPGTLKVTVTYTLTNKDELRIDYSAKTDKPTIINMTNHAFFNLFGFSGGVSKSITNHMLKINAANYTPTDSMLIPTGTIASVEGTPFDFQSFKTIGERINEPCNDLKYGKGYDHNWVLDKHGDKMTEAAIVYEPSNGRQIRVITDEPGLQIYSGNYFAGKNKGKYGEVYTFRSSFTLETQHFPDSPNHSNFPTTTLLPGQTYTSTCIYKFEVR